MSKLPGRESIARVLRFFFKGGTLLINYLKRWLVILRYPTIKIGPAAKVSISSDLKAVMGGSIVLGCSVHLARSTQVICRQGQLDIGSGTFVGQNTVIVARDSISIGRNVLVGESVTIRDQDHGKSLEGAPYHEQPFETAGIVIGNNVWIGAKATILKGVNIGDNAIIGANSVVNTDVAPGDLVGGVPARVLKRFKER